MSREKSAKDIAFDRERLKYRRKIKELEKNIRYWKSRADGDLAKFKYAESVIEEQTEQIESFTKMLKIPTQTLIEHIYNTKKLVSNPNTLQKITTTLL